MNTISVDNPYGIKINPNPPSLIAPTITLPIKVDAEIPVPEFRKFISEYIDALQEKIPTRVDNVTVQVEVVPTVHTHTPYELQDEDSMDISTYYRLYNEIDSSKRKFNTRIHISALQVKHYAGQIPNDNNFVFALPLPATDAGLGAGSSEVHEWVIHCIDASTIIGEIVKFAKGLSEEEKSK